MATATSSRSNKRRPHADTTRTAVRRERDHRSHALSESARADRGRRRGPGIVARSERGRRPGRARPGGAFGDSQFGRQPERGADEVRGGDHLQQLLRVRRQQGRPLSARSHAAPPSVDGAGGRLRGQAEDVRHRRADPAVSARGARLLAALCGSLVDGDPVDRLPARLAAQARRADRAGEVRRVHHVARPQPVSGAEAGILRLLVARLALRRGASPRRGDAPAHAPDGRHVRQGAAQSERRAGARGDPVEVRLQERQVHRPDPPGGRAAQDRVGEGGATGVRLLLQRQPRGEPSALEPGRRTPHRRIPPPAHAAVQRLRRSGGFALRRNGPQEVLLDGLAVTRPARIALKAAVWLVCLAPLALLGYRAWTDDLGANPISFITNTLGDWTLRILLTSLAMTPLRIVFGLSWPIALRRLLGLFAFAYVCLHFAVWSVLDFFFDWPRMWADILKRPYITLGMLALTSLIPLAATSTTGMIRRLGASNWTRLHRLAYVAAVCAVLHYLWLAKVGVKDPYWYAAALVLLLGIRGWDWSRRALRRRRARAEAAPPRARPQAENPLS